MANLRAQRRIVTKFDDSKLERINALLDSLKSESNSVKNNDLTTKNNVENSAEQNENSSIQNKELIPVREGLPSAPRKGFIKIIAGLIKK